MQLTAEDARYMLMGDLEGWEVVKEIPKGNSRWELHYTTIVRHEETGKYYSVDWSRGATEQQDTRPFDYSKPKLIEVIPREVTVVKTIWEPVKE